MKSKPSELWLALRELYRWRKLKHNRSMSSSIFDRLAREEQVTFIEEHYPYYKMAYDMWRAHKNEDVFFGINHFAPDEEPTS